MTINVSPGQRSVVYGTTGVEEVAQCVRTLLATRKGTQPLDRNFGLSYSFLDDPMPVAKGKLEQEIWAALRMYEPRVKLKKITFGWDVLNGRMDPLLTLEILEV